VSVFLSVSTPFLTGSLTEHSIMEPSFFVSFTFVRAVPLRMVFLLIRQRGGARVPTVQARHESIAARLLRGKVCNGIDKHRMSVDSAETG